MKQIPNNYLNVLVVIALITVAVNMLTFSYVLAENYTGKATATGTLSITVAEEAAEEEAVAPTAAPSGGGGGAPSGPSPGTKVGRFFGFGTTGVDAEISTDELKLVLSPGQQTIREIGIKNTGTSFLHFTFDVSFPTTILLSETEIDLESGKSKMIDVTFIAPEDMGLGVYVGTITARAKDLIKEVTVILEVESQVGDFDVELVLPNKYKEIRSVAPTAKFYFPVAEKTIVPQINIFDIGKVGLAEVEVIYEVRDAANNLIFSKSETITVDGQESFREPLDLPATVGIGEYVLTAKVNYEGTTSISSQKFEISETNYVAFVFQYWMYFVIVAAIFIVMAHVISVRRALHRQTKNKTKRRKK